MESRVTVTPLDMGDRKADIEHQFHRVVVGVRLPAVLRQQLEIFRRERRDDPWMTGDDGLGISAPAEHTRHEQTRCVVASRPEQLEDVGVSVEAVSYTHLRAHETPEHL